MKKLIVSLLTVAVVAGGVGFAATNAWFTDTERKHR